MRRTARTDEAAELQDRHLAFRADLRDRGYLIGGGPLVDQDDERLRGISIMACDPETARRLSNEDPAVQAGRLAVEVMTWMVPAGNVRFESVSRAAVAGRGGGGLTRSASRRRGSAGPGAPRSPPIRRSMGRPSKPAASSAAGHTW